MDMARAWYNTDGERETQTKNRSETTMQAYVHEDDSISIPFCELGESIVTGAKYVTGDEKCCSSMNCTCSNDYSVVRKATEKETNDFLVALRSLASEMVDPNA